jgi:hypothetical protein
VDLSLAAQTTAFLQVEVAAILGMPLPEQVCLLPACLIGVLFRVASRRTNPDRPNLPQARHADL